MRLNKSRVITILGVLLSCVLAYGGFFIMQDLLAQKQEKVLSKTSMIPMVSADNKNGKTIRQSKLSKKELREVLTSRQFNYDEPHEPFGYQLTMTEALNKAQEWLDQFCGKYIPLVEGEFYNLNKVTAGLSEKKISEADDTVSKDLYSDWEVTYDFKEMNITLFLNAVTGQVLEARIELNTTDNNMPSFDFDTEELLKDYAASFNLKAKSIQLQNESFQYMVMEEGLYIFFLQNAIKLNDQSKVELHLCIRV